MLYYTILPFLLLSPPPLYQIAILAAIVTIGVCFKASRSNSNSIVIVSDSNNSNSNSNNSNNSNIININNSNISDSKYSNSTRNTGSALGTSGISRVQLIQSSNLIPCSSNVVYVSLVV